MGFLKKLLGLEPKSVKLLSARIVTDQTHRYYIIFSKYQQKLQPMELVRLTLHYYAKILFSLDQSDSGGAESANILKKMMRTVIDKKIHKDSDILRDAGIDAAAKIASSEPQNKPIEIVATLFFIDKRKRRISLDIPRKPDTKHLMFSVMALIHATLVYLNQDCIDVLNRSLAAMHDVYDSGQSFSDMKSLTVTPTEVFMSATNSDG